MILLATLLLLQTASNPLVVTGYDHFYNIEFPQAIAAFQQAATEDPANPQLQNHLAQAVLFSMMFRAGALETEMVTGGNAFARQPGMEPTPAEQKLFDEAIAESIRLSKAALEKDPNDTAALYAQGAALSFRGTYNYLVRKAWLDALRDSTAARKLHNRVAELDPANIDAMLMQGAHDYMVGSLPATTRALVILLGFHGDREGGIRTLQLVAEKGTDNKVDAEILLGIIARRERRPQDAIPICLSLHERYPRNWLILFELSQMYADLGDKEKALQALTRVEELKLDGSPGFGTLSLERIEYARGNLLFWYDETDAAIRHLRRATANAQFLDPNSAASAWLRLGQCLDLKGLRDDARAAYRTAVRDWPHSDEARSARRYLSRPFTQKEKTSISGAK
ncbi:MAG: tetratricopeptide repeat protein [Bryobacterales bacterium]|nr:tetratricopeptide repeat protein [Bryobacterales bacterium]